MVDLLVGPMDALEIAIECTGAVDPVFTKTWNTGPARGPMRLDMRGNWNITIRTDANLNAIKRKLERILQQLNARGARSVRADHLLERIDPSLFWELDALGISSASCYELPGVGEVHFLMHGLGGASGYTGEEVSAWLAEFLRAPERADVLAKLARNAAPQKQAFIIATLHGAPWPVFDYFTNDLTACPAPRLICRSPSPACGLCVT